MRRDFSAPWEVKRPFVCFARGFAALALLFAVCTPFLDNLPVSHWVIMFTGLGISAVFSFFATGLCLLPNQTRRCVMAGMKWGHIITLILLGAILASLHIQPSLSVMHLILKLSAWVLWAFVAVALAFACYGWYRRLFAGLRRPESHL